MIYGIREKCISKTSRFVGGDCLPTNWLLLRNVSSHASQPVSGTSGTIMRRKKGWGHKPSFADFISLGFQYVDKHYQLDCVSQFLSLVTDFCQFHWLGHPIWWVSRAWRGTIRVGISNSNLWVDFYRLVNKRSPSAHHFSNQHSLVMSLWITPSKSNPYYLTWSNMI